ncbi:MAG: SH3 domain-containing protein, partial [Anaerolineae bacterium]|nr:SH3 domain-containing protein [Anaerolineae bacterium]
ARVIPGGGPNRLRSEASAQSAQIGLIAEGDVVTVLYGPICDRDVVWWQVDYNGVVGWTAEGQGGTYFLDPAG